MAAACDPLRVSVANGSRPVCPVQHNKGCSGIARRCFCEQQLTPAIPWLVLPLPLSPLLQIPLVLVLSSDWEDSGPCSRTPPKGPRSSVANEPQVAGCCAESRALRCNKLWEMAVADPVCHAGLFKYTVHPPPKTTTRRCPAGSYKATLSLILKSPGLGVCRVPERWQIIHYNQPRQRPHFKPKTVAFPCPHSVLRSTERSNGCGPWDHWGLNKPL